MQEGMGISEEITVTVVKANANLLGIEIVLGLFALAFLGFLYFKLRKPKIKNLEVEPKKYTFS